MKNQTIIQKINQENRTIVYRTSLQTESITKAFVFFDFAGSENSANPSGERQ
jgi:hypothetical protein